jgi:hypothetical protein
MLAAVRPDSYNLALYVHVGGAMLLVGALVIATFAARTALRRGDHPAVAFAARVLLLGVLPAFIAMRVGAQWIVSKEHLEDADLAWIGIGFAISDGGALLLIIALIVTGLAARKARAGSIAGSGLLRAAMILTALMIATDVVAIWAMTTKPT